MKKILLFLIILLSTSIASAAATDVDRTTSSNYSTKVNEKPTRPTSNVEDKSDDPIDEDSDDMVYLPPMDLPPMNTPTDSDQNETEVEIPDYSIPDVKTEESKPPTPETPQIEETEGLEFIVVHRDGIMAFAIIADHEKYILKPVLARDQVPGRATVKSMSDSYNAIAAVNASYFALNGVILGNTKIDDLTVGTTYFTRSAMGINSDGSTIFGKSAYHGVVSIAGESLNIGGVDCERGPDSVVIYNKHQGSHTGTNDFGVEYRVENGIITEIFTEHGNNPIPVNGFIVSAHGKAAELFKNAQIGDPVTFDESIINVDNTGDFDRAIQVIGAGPRLVKDSNIYVTADEEQFPNDIRIGRAPRTAVGVTKYGDYILAVVDGRQAHSKGCTLQEWATILLNDFGAVNAINLDGGGSTELVVKGDIVNSPSDGRERPVGDALVLIRS